MDTPARRPSGRNWLVRAEDWLLAGWVALVAPTLGHVQATAAGPFDGGRPMDGIVGLVAVLGAVACLALPVATRDAGGLGVSAAVGPFVGGLLLVAISSVTALGLGDRAGAALALAAAAVAVVVRMRLPPASNLVRRALVTPYVLVTGSIFWQIMNAVTGEGGAAFRLGGATLSQFQAAVPALGFLLAFSAVYYAMLVYAPRQVAEREGGPVAWIARYGLFAASVLLGTSWLAALGA